jgi:hypothetical protein
LNQGAEFNSRGFFQFLLELVDVFLGVLGVLRQLLQKREHGQEEPCHGPDDRQLSQAGEKGLNS